MRQKGGCCLGRGREGHTQIQLQHQTLTYQSTQGGTPYERKPVLRRGIQLLEVEWTPNLESKYKKPGSHPGNPHRTNLKVINTYLIHSLHDPKTKPWRARMREVVLRHGVGWHCQVGKREKGSRCMWYQYELSRTDDGDLEVAHHRPPEDWALGST